MTSKRAFGQEMAFLQCLAVIGILLCAGCSPQSNASDAGVRDGGATDAGGADGGTCSTPPVTFEFPSPTTTEVENQKTPATDLLQFKPSSVDCWKTDSCAIQAYADKTSVSLGDTLGFHVSATDGNGGAASVVVDFYRLGYYGGKGAHKVGHFDPGVTIGHYPMPAADPDTQLVDAAWPEAFSVTIGGQIFESDLHTGVYVARIMISSGPNQGYAWFVPFVLRPPADAQAELLVVLPDVTWQAYNQWGFTSLYTAKTCPLDVKKVCPECCQGFNRIRHAAGVAVSFDRPYANEPRGNSLPGTAFLAHWDLWSILWFEAQGYETAYYSGLDLDDPTLGDPSRLASHFLTIVSIGHDEYWSRGMREHAEGARDLGVHLAFFSGNTSFWKVRFEPSDRTGVARRKLVGYKFYAQADPLFGTGDPDVTGPWRTIDWSTVPGYPDPNPVPTGAGHRESLLTGLSNGSMSWPWGNARVASGMSSHWAFSGIAGVADGEIFEEQVFGHESMSDEPDLRPEEGSVEVLASVETQSGPTPPPTQDRVCLANKLLSNPNLAMAVWTRPNGGMTFSAGSINWGWLLTKPVGVTYANTCGPAKTACCDPNSTPPWPAPSLPSPRIQALTKNLLDCFSGRRQLTDRCGRRAQAGCQGP
ncbi:MAG: hypothetical protein D6729_14555 [Deltaproteobacteria bacterium]|nr:MAG: hypothetical protein D6729_14555 [Deltaproteobacteria bacterium]